MALGLSLVGRPAGLLPALGAPAEPRVAPPATPAPDAAADSATISVSPQATVEGTQAPGAKKSIPDTLREIGNKIALGVANTLAGVKLVGYGLVYRAEGKLTESRETLYQPSEKLPTPTIARPFVLIPGWTTTHRNFNTLTDHLTRDGANGGETYFVKQGNFYTRNADGDLQPLATPPPNGRVFELVWTDTHQSPDKNVPEMRQNLEAICQATGFDKVDVEGFSMGGLDTRLYLDQGGDRINRHMMLGTPNRGTRFGDLVLDVLDRDVQWAKKFADIGENDRDSMYWLRQEANSPLLQDLNSRFPQQAQRVPTLSVGANIMPTAGKSWFTRGDGLVPATSLELPGCTTLVLHEAMQHGRLNDDATVQHVRAIFFGWRLPPGTESQFPKEDAEIIQHVPHP